MKMRITFLWACLCLMPVFDGETGVDPELLENYKITGYSRPCCRFNRTLLSDTIGFTGVLGIQDLGSHSFARRHHKDNIGVMYSCHGGFIDVSHLRDNADWSAHLFTKLPEWLGSGKDIPARREGGFHRRSVYFPKISPRELSELTEDDLEKLAVSIGFSMALLHEIPTSFRISVSVPFAFVINERSSAFSFEDAYSNLLGNILGAKAARSQAPYDEAMTDILFSTLTELEGQDRQRTLEAFELVRNDWWLRGTFRSNFKKILRRDFSYQDGVEPFVIKKASFCPSVSARRLEIPSRLSNGRSVHDYYSVRGVMTKKLKRSLKKLGLKVNGTITQKDFPEIIKAIRQLFIQLLGPQIEMKKVPFRPESF